MGKGIDYGMGRTNIDNKNGIRYGVIPSHEVCQAWDESSEADYGKPCCPECGNEVVDDNELDREDYRMYRKHGCDDYACDNCRMVLDSSDVYGEEAIGFNLDDGEYVATQGHDDSDIFIIKSPYFTRAAFCSPCAPGACYLLSSREDGERAYCFGHDWFDDNKAPYPVYSVETGERVYADGETEEDSEELDS